VFSNTARQVACRSAREKRGVFIVSAIGTPFAFTAVRIADENVGIQSSVRLMINCAVADA
jgi:hypothetical protein